MATLEQLEQALINADKAGDVDAARKLASAVVSARGESSKKEPGLLDKIGDVFTGNLRKTPETESLPEWVTMPEMNQLSGASFKAGLGTLLSPTAEIPQILKAQFPDMGVRQDSKGNYILKSPSNGQEYAIPPGMTIGDLPRIIGGFAAFTPAGRATSLLGLGAAGGATQAAIEATQAATGGEFNPGEIAAATILPPAGVAIARAASPAVNAVFNKAGRPGATPATPSVQPAAPVTSPVTPPVTPAIPAVQAAEEVATLGAEELAKTARQAAQGSGRAREVLATQAAPDQEAIAAAERLGILDNLQPDHLTTNQAYRELAQAVKSVPGSQARSIELEGLEAVAKRADDLIEEIGGEGARDVSLVSQRIKNTMQITQKELEDKAEILYAQVEGAIPRSTKVDATNIVGILRSTADELGGIERLSPIERRLLNDLSTTPTYAFLDRTRKQIGQATSKGSGPFKDSETGLLKRLYGALAEDQIIAADAAGVGDFYKAASAAVRTRKGLEDDLTSLYGKDLGGTIVGDLSSGIKSLAKGDTEKLARLIDSTPENMRREVVASGLRYAFNRNLTSGQLNPATYTAWYEGLRKNSQAYSLIAKNLDEAALKQMNDLYKVTKGISLASKERITTGRLQAVKDDIQGTENLIERLYGVAKKSGTTIAAEGASSAMGLPGVGIAAGLASALTKGKTDVMKAADAVISSPEFIKMATSYEKTGTVNRGLVKRLAHSRAMNNYVRNLKDKQELSNREQFILNALQTGRQRDNRTVH